MNDKKIGIIVAILVFRLNWEIVQGYNNDEWTDDVLQFKHYFNYASRNDGSC